MNEVDGKTISKGWTAMIYVLFACYGFIFLVDRGFIYLGIEHSAQDRSADLFFYVLFGLSLGYLLFGPYLIDSGKIFRQEQGIGASNADLRKSFLKIVLAESIGVFGLLYFFLYGNLSYAGILGFMSLVLFLRIRPQIAI